jgi:hypothetical protein
MTKEVHMRLTLGSPRTSGSSRTALATKILAPFLGATLVLSACGAQEVDAAAIVDGKVIKDKDVQTVSLQLSSLAQGQKLSSSNVLLSLILAPYVASEAARTHKSVSDSQVRKLIEKVAKPAPTTMEFVRMQLALPALDETSKTSILTRIGKAKITVNPRYGTFNAKQVALVPSSPNWIKASPPSVDPNSNPPVPAK